MAVIQVGEHSGLEQVAGNRDGKKRSKPGSILKVEVTGFLIDLT